MLSNLFKTCGRKVCSCQKELWALRVRIPLDRKEHIDLQKKIQTDSPGARLDNLEKELEKDSNVNFDNKTISEEKINISLLLDDLL